MKRDELRLRTVRMHLRDRAEQKKLDIEEARCVSPFTAAQ